MEKSNLKEKNVKILAEIFSLQNNIKKIIFFETKTFINLLRASF
jgi:hypothetical protein